MNIDSSHIKKLEDELIQLARAVRRVQAASTSDGAPLNALSNLSETVRKLRVARELNDINYIAIGGSQGAGKTHLLRKLYNLDDTWFAEDIGRGEKIPVFIVEQETLKSPRGIILQAADNGDLHEQEVDSDTFKKYVRAWSNDGKSILAKLYVPQKYFESGRGFVLLPGYERLKAANNKWQRLMRYSLNHALSCIIVVRESMLADVSQQEIMNDMTTNCFEGRKFILAISKTEGKSEEDKRSLITRAAQVYGIPMDELDRIVCTGSIDIDHWVTQLGSALEKYIYTTMSPSTSRMKELEEITDTDLNDVICEAEEFLGNEGVIDIYEKDPDYQRVMEAFERAVDRFKNDYRKELRNQLGPYKKRATDTALDEYTNSDEGFKGSLKSGWRFLSQTSGQRERRAFERIERHWLNHQEGNEGKTKGKGTELYKIDTTVLNTLARKTLSLGSPEHSTDLVSILGYGTEDTSSSSLRNQLQQSDVHEIAALLLPDSRDNQPSPSTKSLSELVKRLPALTMEYVRVEKNLNVMIAETLGELPDEKTRVNALENILQDLQELTGQAELILQSLDSLFGMDGKASNITSLIQLFQQPSQPNNDVGSETPSKNSSENSNDNGGLPIIPPIAGGPLLIAMTGIMLATSVAAITRSAQETDARQRNFIRISMDGLLNAYIDGQLILFDDAMDSVRDRVEAGVKRLYGLDDSEKDRDFLLRSLARLKRTRNNFLDVIYEHPMA